MLKDDLYSITAIDEREGSISAVLQLNSAHPIFSGHFPNQPVLPGACMLQMLKEILEQALKTNIRLKKADQMKFLLPVDPAAVSSGLELSLTYLVAEMDISVNATMKSQDIACFKFKGVFMKL